MAGRFVLLIIARPTSAIPIAAQKRLPRASKATIGLAWPLPFIWPPPLTIHVCEAE
jgi:hypothetical protein